MVEHQVVNETLEAAELERRVAHFGSLGEFRQSSGGARPAAH